MGTASCVLDNQRETVITELLANTETLTYHTAQKKTTRPKSVYTFCFNKRVFIASAETSGRAWPWSAGVGLEAPEVPTAAAEPVPGQPTGRVAPPQSELSTSIIYALPWHLSGLGLAGRFFWCYIETFRRRLFDFEHERKTQSRTHYTLTPKPLDGGLFL